MGVIQDLDLMGEFDPASRLIRRIRLDKQSIKAKTIEPKMSSCRVQKKSWLNSKNQQSEKLID